MKRYGIAVMPGILVKVYASLFPADLPCAQALHEALGPFIGRDEAERSVTLERGLLNLGYEGRYFPLEEALEILLACSARGASGRLDYLDLEAWRMIRHTISLGLVETASASLNNVLDYSGF